MNRRAALRAGALFIGAGVTSTRATRAAAQGYEPLGSLDLAGAKEAVVSPDGTVAYLAVTDGYATVDVSDPADPRPLAVRRGLLADREDGPMVQVYDVKASGDTLAVVGPAHPGSTAPHGALLVDVADPADPVRRGFYETDFPIHNCFLDGSTLYLTGNGLPGNPLVIVDVAADPPREVGRWTLTEYEPAWRDVDSGLRVLHDVWVRDGLAALAHWDAGTHLLDVTDPTEPVHVGSVTPWSPAELQSPPAAEGVTPPGNHHYVATDPGNDLLAIGVESWAADTDDGLVGGPGGVTLYDVSDPSSPRRLSRIPAPPTSEPTYRGVWTTAHNFELRGGTLYTSWYRGGVKRHDVTDPANPVEETWWADPDAAKVWTARTATPGGFFVASSMGTPNATAGLWTFPDRAGRGGDPAALTATPTATADPTPTAASTPTATSTPTANSAEPTDSTSSPAATAADGTASAAAAPGLGALAGLAGVGLAAWRGHEAPGGGTDEGDGEDGEREYHLDAEDEP